MEAVKNALHSAQEKVTQVANDLNTTIQNQLDPKARDLNQHIVEDGQEGNSMTTNFGVKLGDDDNSLKAGPRGPTLLQDFHFREKMTHFDHERIPERIVHARGSAAHGYFQAYEDLSEYTKADFLSQANKKTPVFVRFSTVLGSRGAADTVRDVRGFAIKFYTEEGNFDMVGNNMPIFFVQDALKFVDLIHAGKPEPDNEVPQGATDHDNFWDFISLTPESTHMIMWALSDRAIPRSYRMMQGFGIHSFILVNKEGKRRFIKWHLKPVLGVNSLVWDEAMQLRGVDPDFHRKDLWEAIESGAFPEFEVGIQIVEEQDEHKFDFDLLDSTKIIPEELVPVKMIGKLVLNRNPDNFFAETEQVAYCTQHLVPGIEASNDPLMQGRMFSYHDTQLSRLGGPNFQEIPINRPVCPVFNNQRDGIHRMTINKGKANYFPNRFGCPGIDKIKGYSNFPEPTEGVKIRAKGPKFFDFYTQARLFYNSLSEWEKLHLTEAAKFELGHVEDQGIRERMVNTFNHVDFELAKKVAFAIGVEAPKESLQSKNENKSPALSQDHSSLNPRDSIKSRKVAFLIGQQYKGAQLKALKTYLEGLGAVVVVVGPRKGAIPSDSAEVTEVAKFTFDNCKSLLFDACVVIGGQGSVNYLNSIGAPKAFVSEAFKHGKPIAAFDEGVDFVKSLQLPGMESHLATQNGQVVSHLGVLTAKDAAVNPDSMKTFFNILAAHRNTDRDDKKVAA